MYKYLCISQKEFKTRSIYRFATFMTIVSIILTLTVKIFLFQGLTTRGALTANDLHQLIVYSFFVVVIQNLFLFGIMNKNAEAIRLGTVSYSFIKPIPLFTKSIFEVIGLKCYSFIFVVIPFYIGVSVLYTPITVHIQSLTAFIAFILCFFFVLFFEQLLSALVFFTMNTWGLENVKRSLMLLLGGQFIPIQYYPDMIQPFIKALPFQYFFDVPIRLLMGNGINGINFLILIGWNVFTYSLYKFVYKKGVSRVVIQGG